MPPATVATPLSLTVTPPALPFAPRPCALPSRAGWMMTPVVLITAGLVRFLRIQEGDTIIQITISGMSTLIVYKDYEDCHVRLQYAV
jgi:hypothetical protein